MTLFTTIVTGVLVFVLGQILLKWLIEPIQELRKTISEILFFLVNDYSTIHNADVLNKQEVLSTVKNIKRLAAHLLACQQLIPFYEYTHRLFRLPKSEDIKYASKQLYMISKSTFGEEEIRPYRIDLYRINVYEALGLEDPIQDSMTKSELIDGIKEIQNRPRS